MDKYEYRVSLNEINSLVDEKRFDEAAQIADTIDWRKVKSKDTLCRISDIYKVCKDYERARDILDLANQRNPHVPEIIYSLCELTIFLYGKTGSQVDLTKAIGLRQEYQNECPNDPKRLILEYKFYKVSPVTLTEKIATLEKLRDEDHSARWGYELASLYHEAGMEDLALDECQTIRRSFGGRFAERAAVLADEIKAAGDAQREQAEDESGTAEPEEQAPAVAAQESGTEREEAAASVDTAVSEVEETTEQAEHVAPEREAAPVQEAAAEPVQIPEEPERNEAPETDVQAEAGYEPETPVEKAPEQTDVPDTTSDDQLSVGQVYDEWERIRKDIRKRNDEKRAQRIMEDTGPLLQDFDETARHGLIEAIEKDAARERRQIRSGASSILGGDAGYGRSDRYGQGGDRYRDSYDDRRGRDAYDDSYDRGYDDRRYEDSYDDRYAEPYDDRDRYAEPAEDSYDRRGYAEESYEDRGYARSADDRYDDRYAYEPLPQPEDTYEEPAPRRDEIHAETVHEEPDGYTDDVRGAENDRWSPARAAMDVAGDAIGAAQQRRGSRFQAAVTAAGAAANVGGAVAGDLADAASEDDDIATRRWNSDEIRQAMEAQSRRMAEAQAAAEEEARRKAEEEEQARIAAEEEARRKAAEEEARRAAEARAAAEAEQRARMEAEIRARYEAEEKARIEAEEKARREAEEKAAAEARAREEEEAKARMYAEIEARIRAEFEEREQARLAALGISNAPVSDAGDAATTEPAAVQAEPAAEDSAASEERSVQEPAADAVEEEPVPEVAVYTEEPAYGAEPLTEDTAFTQNSDPEQGLDQTSSFDTTAFLAATLAQDAESDEESIDEPSRGRRGRGTGEDAAQDTFGQAAPVVSPETAEMPASAASSIAAASEKAPSEEELRLFGPFYRMKENRDQVTAALDRISLASYTGNLIITGNAVTARRVAQGLLELTREADSNFTGRIAKATGTALNKLTTEKFQGILNKIQNGALIIEHASTMEGPAIQCLYNELENRDRGVVVVIMDARKPLDAFLAQYSDLVGSFTARVDIRPLNDKALVDYGKDYANAKDYALDELAELALSSRISGMQTPNHRVTLKEVRDIIDEAISYASKKSPKVLMDMISHKRYDEDDRVILHEKDFQHY